MSTVVTTSSGRIADAVEIRLVAVLLPRGAWRSVGRKSDNRSGGSRMA
jgi:hypothetical protein